MSQLSHVSFTAASAAASRCERGGAWQGARCRPHAARPATATLTLTSFATLSFIHSFIVRPACTIVCVDHPPVRCHGALLYGGELISTALDVGNPQFVGQAGRVEKVTLLTGKNETSWNRVLGQLPHTKLPS